MSNRDYAHLAECRDQQLPNGNSQRDKQFSNIVAARPSVSRSLSALSYARVCRRSLPSAVAMTSTVEPAAPARFSDSTVTNFNLKVASEIRTRPCHRSPEHRTDADA